jgi:hypothetical protein
VEDRQRERQIGEEDDARLERRDEQRLAMLVVVRDLTTELVDARSDLVGAEVDLTNPGVERVYASWSPKRCARRSTSRL